MTRRLPEQRLWDRFRNNCGHDLRLERIENMVGDGIPDVLALGDGVVTFVELKCNPQRPLRMTSQALGRKYGPRPSQRAWHLDWARRGGKSLFLVEVQRELFLHDGLCADHLHEYSMNDMVEQSLAGSWRDIIYLLKSGSWAQ